MAAKGSALKGALAATPRGGRVTSLPVGKPPAPTAGLQRLSPGVYRNQQGQLVNSKGGKLPGQQQQMQQPRPSDYLPYQPQTRPPFQALPGQQPQQPTWRPPAPNPPMQDPMYFAGGSPNFNELTGMYNQPAYSYPGQEYWKSMQGGFGYGVGGQNFAPQQGMQQAPSQEAQQQQQLQTQAAMAPQNPMYKGNIY